MNFEDDNSAYLKIPQRYLKKAGILDIRFEGNPKIKLQLAIEANSASGIVDVFTGPKTVAADYHQPAMIVGITKDQFGNPISEDSKINFKFESAVIIDQADKKQKNLICFSEIPLQEQVGKIYMSAASGEARSKENFLEIKPGSPSKFSITANRLNQFANETENTIITSSVIKDKYGNQVTDGT